MLPVVTVNEILSGINSRAPMNTRMMHMEIDAVEMSKKASARKLTS